MADQGYPYEGKDHRVLGKFGAAIQRFGTFKCKIPPPSITFEVLGIRVNIPIGVNKYLCLRIHLWRWDAYNDAYIFVSSMSKRVNSTEVMP